MGTYEIVTERMRDALHAAKRRYPGDLWLNLTSEQRTQAVYAELRRIEPTEP